jgi:hypothetical protein
MYRQTVYVRRSSHGQSRWHRLPVSALAGGAAAHSARRRGTRDIVVQVTSWPKEEGGCAKMTHRPRNLAHVSRWQRWWTSSEPCAPRAIACPRPAARRGIRTSGGGEEARGGTDVLNRRGTKRGGGRFARMEADGGASGLYPSHAHPETAPAHDRQRREGSVRAVVERKNEEAWAG